MILALVIAPAAAGLIALLLKHDRWRRALLVGTAAAHAVIAGACWRDRPGSLLQGWLGLDAPGLLFLGITSVLFLAGAVYAVSYLGREVRGRRADFVEGAIFSNAPEAIFTSCLLFLLATMTLVCVSRHLGLMWVAVEATTLASAPLIYFHRHHRSLEATWKYLVICSVGIGLALLGTLCLAVAAARPGAEAASMVIDHLLAPGGVLEPGWVRLAFVLLLVGYGTKMGLAPLHTWLPDAHSESPSLVSALLSGAVLNCAFLAILRARQVLDAAGQGAFGRHLLLMFGLASIAVAAVYLVGQTDYKRMLAYSSVEHMGIMALGAGLGGAGAFGAMLHAVNHSLAKGMMFLVAGNILSFYRTKRAAEVRGLLHALPRSGLLWAAGLFALTGSPPFGPFLSEFAILRETLAQGRIAVAVAYLSLLALAFLGMGKTMLDMALGPGPGETIAGAGREAWASWVAPAALGAGVLLLGVYIPPALQGLIEEASRLTGGL